ncbi:hypothetical protein [Verminephrobacter eiseniae]|uniref:hypothetical protein n=1 Tax=Verminephrobacter eiseniae TaxID=364317 RepID=UPI0010DF1BD6|nr:hypothetical protein [Verminephrobacter eiseniae]KAB7619334.1 hypothetical protein ET532_007035 [Verminephrobacter sp. Larva24]MCW5231478.1 hypothetical protein [Verminephrobacter eiseniae]MCW5293207.1 hypothetical protein [Verminephrobacter eiseniae]MCW8186565.1 hypothetical protein [Verminephrobacter eiseniae]MCW8223959.1 hypothetical protein [Verminephrobacter eiseniae]
MEQGLGAVGALCTPDRQWIASASPPAPLPSAYPAFARRLRHALPGRSRRSMGQCLLPGDPVPGDAHAIGHGERPCGNRRATGPGRSLAAPGSHAGR